MFKILKSNLLQEECRRGWGSFFRGGRRDGRHRREELSALQSAPHPQLRPQHSSEIQRLPQPCPLSCLHQGKLRLLPQCPSPSPAPSWQWMLVPSPQCTYSAATYHMPTAAYCPLHVRNTKRAEGVPARGGDSRGGSWGKLAAGSPMNWAENREGQLPQELAPLSWGCPLSSSPGQLPFQAPRRGQSQQFVPVRDSNLLQGELVFRLRGS